MRSVAPMRIAKIGYLVMSALLCLIGVLLILFPNISLRLAGIFVSIILCVFGAIKLVGFFSKDLFRLAFENDLASGILMLALGISLLFHTEGTLSFLCTVLGILILTDGMLRIEIAMDARPFGIPLWWLILMFAIFTGAFGCLLIFRPSESMEIMVTILGLSLICDSILNFITILTTVKIIRKQYPNNIEKME